MKIVIITEPENTHGEAHEREKNASTLNLEFAKFLFTPYIMASNMFIILLVKIKKILITVKKINNTAFQKKVGMFGRNGDWCITFFKTICSFILLKSIFCENMNEISPVALAVALGPHDNVPTDNNVLKHFLRFRGL